MAPLFRTTRDLIARIDEFLDQVSRSGESFGNGIRHYLAGEHEAFMEDLRETDAMEGKADELRRAVEDSLYRHSLLPEFRGDVMRLLEWVDELADIAQENLFQFEVESPSIPESLHPDFLRLTELSVGSVGEVTRAAGAFFREPRAVHNMLEKIYSLEKEADMVSNTLKRKLFKEMPDLHLSQKNHIRHFITQTENLSDVSENIADFLVILAIKRSN
jgi:hypothetical protein